MHLLLLAAVLQGGLQAVGASIVPNDTQPPDPWNFTCRYRYDEEGHAPRGEPVVHDAGNACHELRAVDQSASRPPGGARCEGQPPRVAVMILGLARQLPQSYSGLVDCLIGPLEARSSVFLNIDTSVKDSSKNWRLAGREPLKDRSNESTPEELEPAQLSSLGAAPEVYHAERAGADLLVRTGAHR